MFISLKKRPILGQAKKMLPKSNKVLKERFHSLQKACPSDPLNSFKNVQVSRPVVFGEELVQNSINDCLRGRHFNVRKLGF